ncbi:MAG: ribbon-helix-helix protein, CopG family [Lysobacteraceae bacterium]|jgi:predicted transcriptional regulator
MSTTTIRIPDELKARLSRIAEQEGTSTHGLILEAIAEKADALERRQAFHEEARERHEHFLATGESIPWEEMRDYLRRRVRGEDVQPPVARRLGK